AWMSAYNDFILKYESGMTIMEIVAEGNVSRRTAYRYLEYYKGLQDQVDETNSVKM
ncbi:MAG: helix-turn-helix domain-containing protein, partial [Butyrivibrio sp.]|nr:helix-turn-helix domain-containing protein [Butyrivibrio sp.]